MGYWPNVRSRWLDIGQVRFLRVYGPRRKKGFIIWLSGRFFKRDTAGSPERARLLHLARSGSQSQRAIWFILPDCGASHIINWDITCSSDLIGHLSHMQTTFVSTYFLTNFTLLLGSIYSHCFGKWAHNHPPKTCSAVSSRGSMRTRESGGNRVYFTTRIIQIDMHD